MLTPLRQLIVAKNTQKIQLPLFQNPCYTANDSRKQHPSTKTNRYNGCCLLIVRNDYISQYVLTIGENEYRYSVLDYVKACLDSTKVSEQTKDLVSATYRYKEAAKAYFI